MKMKKIIRPVLTYTVARPGRSRREMNQCWDFSKRKFLGKFMGFVMKMDIENKHP